MYFCWVTLGNRVQHFALSVGQRVPGAADIGRLPVPR